MGAKAGAAPLEAPGGSEIADRNRIAAGVAQQLLCDLHRLRIAQPRRPALALTLTHRRVTQALLF